MSQVNIPAPEVQDRNVRIVRTFTAFLAGIIVASALSKRGLCGASGCFTAMPLGV